MKYLLLSILSCLVISCDSTYMQTPGGNKIHIGQLGGKKTIQGISVGQGADQITIVGYSTDFAESLKDVTRMTNSIFISKHLLEGLRSQEATKVVESKESTKVLTNESNNLKDVTINASNNELAAKELEAAIVP